MPTIGPDIASVDGNKDIDWKKVWLAGGRFVAIRAVYGRPVVVGTTQPYLDPTWRREAPRARAAGLKVCAYLFVCVPRAGAFTPSPDVQAQAYIDYVDLTAGVDFVPAFDVEEPSDMLTADQYYAWILRVAKILWQHFGVWPMMYFSHRVWHELLKDHAAGELINCLPWIAKPWPWAVRTPVHLDGAPGYTPDYIPQWGNMCGFYQYQGDGLGWPGLSATCDVNRIEVTKRGAKGKQVEWIQARVGAAVDGDYGPATEEAVKVFQRAHQLDDDGIVGMNTMLALGWVVV